MTSPISAISSLGSIASTGAAASSSSIASIGSATGSGAATSTGSAGASDFASVLGKGLDAVSSAQNSADSLAIQAATGDLTNVHDYTIAATQASLITELATTIRTKGVDAFNQIMGMQA
jgi:flagellar hook-basal body complex protein FliE